MSDKLVDLLKIDTIVTAIPENHEVECIECGWKGYLRDCKQDEEQDGWEYPLYTIYLCPKCEGLVEI